MKIPSRSKNMMQRTQLFMAAMVLAVTTITGSIVLPAQQAHAASLDDFSFSSTSYAPGATATYTFNYTTINNSNLVWKVQGMPQVNFSQSTAQVTINGTVHNPAVGGMGYWNGAHPYIRLGNIGYTIPGGSAVQVVLTGVINPSNPGTYTATTFGSTTDQLVHVDSAPWSLTIVGPLGFTNPSNKQVLTQNTRAVTDLAITGGSGSDVVNINLFAEEGSLEFGSSTGLTFTGATTGNNLQFSGTKNAINAALATLQYKAGTQVGTFKIEALINEAGGGVVWSENGHAYKVVSDPLSWSAAKAAAEAQTFGGVSGYLATITSQEEHDFVLQRINQSGWIGASDSGDEGNWSWRTGPEAGQQFWQGNGAGHTVNDMFANWSENEPNNANSIEDCAQIRFTESIHGLWNDLDCSAANPNYVVEFGTPDALPQVVQTSFNITVMPYTYTLSFDAQGGTAVESITGIEEGQMVTLPAASEQAGYIFKEWNLSADGEGADYTPGGSFQMNGENTTFYAIWKEDGNIDEVPDEEQENVVSLTDPATGERITLEIDESCTMASATMLANGSLAVKDAAYNYATDFVNFTATGCDDDKTTVNLYYYGTSGDGLTVRKHNPNKNSFFTINDALLTKRVIAEQNVTIVSYEVTDGGDLDIDGLKNGTITDPVGLGRLVVNAPNTGLGGKR